MARRKKRQSGLSWEMIGIVAMLAVFLVLGLVWFFGSDEGATAVTAPDVTTAAPEMDTGETERGFPYLGSADAPVTFYEFADFQCPHCRDFSTLYSVPIKDDYIAAGQARLVFVPFPFMGDESWNAARAGYCAKEQGQFWAMHDYLFANQPTMPNTGNFSDSNTTAMAEAIGLDVEAFEACIGSNEAARWVQSAKDFGSESGVQSTPSFLVGETVIEGNNMEQLSSALDAAAGG